MNAPRNSATRHSVAAERGSSPEGEAPDRPNAHVEKIATPRVAGKAFVVGIIRPRARA